MIEKILERLEEELNESGVIDDDDYFLGKYNACNDAISIVKEESQNGGWIPCSERLPEEKGWYQCTCEDSSIWSKPIVRDLYFYPNLDGFIDNIRYESDGMKDIMRFNWSKYVTAWMPLPEPYKGE